MSVCQRSLVVVLGCIFAVLLCLSAGCVSTPETPTGDTITITDAFGREVTVPDNPQKIAVSGSGSMRYFVYLDVDLDRIVAVDYQDSSLFSRSNELRPYLLANPEIKNRQELGSAMAVVDNEKLLASGAEVLFMGGASSSQVEVADEITAKTGVPVVMFYTGDYVTKGDEIRNTLRMLGTILHEEERAEEIIAYFASIEEDIKTRVANVSETDKPTV